MVTATTQELASLEAEAVGEPRVRLRGIGKRFYERGTATGSLKESLLGMLSTTHAAAEIVALKGIDLETRDGEILGLVGANGSGKSTLLKIIAGITQPSEGEVGTRGRVIGMIELGAGFHRELSGEENIRLQGAVFGLRRKEIERKMDAIFDYAELQDFRRTELKFYSSGMVARLGFAAAIHSDPDVLLVDEALSVGDQPFQEKCLRTFDELRTKGVATVFVTHNMEFAERVCDRIIWLKGGQIHQAGNSSDMLAAYHDEMIETLYGKSEGQLTPARVTIPIPGRFGSGEVRMTRVRTVDANGRPHRNFKRGESFAIEIEYLCESEIEAVDCSITIEFEDGAPVSFWRAECDGKWQKPEKNRGMFRLLLPSPILLPGRYRFSPALSPLGGGEVHYDLQLWMQHFTILEDDKAFPLAPILLTPVVRVE